MWSNAERLDGYTKSHVMFPPLGCNTPIKSIDFINIASTELPRPI